MFENLTTRLGNVFDRLRQRGALTEDDVVEALRDVRIALLEADVALPVVRDFVAGVREKAVGQEVVRSITPGQMVVKIVHDHLVELLGSETVGLELGSPPAVVLMCGLQGSGKTTTTAKLARQLKVRDRKKVLVASLDVQRPAAQHQLDVLAQQAEVMGLPVVPGQKPLDITRRALETARREGYDVLILDTAGRLHVDQVLMDELVAVHEGGAAARDAARRRRPDRPGCGQRRQPVQGPGRPHRHRADPDGRRRARRRCSQHARGHRQADQARGYRREARGAGAVSPAARGGAHPRHGGRRLPGREGSRGRRPRRGREAGQAHGQGQLRSQRPALAAAAR